MPGETPPLIDEAHLDLYVLWRKLSGMGGNSLAELWALVGQPGSAALFRDFGILSSREGRLEDEEKFFEEYSKGRRRPRRRR